jgi:hypothetical protein
MVLWHGIAQLDSQSLAYSQLSPSVLQHKLLHSKLLALVPRNPLTVTLGIICLAVLMPLDANDAFGRVCVL